jgi:hypothetical protein
MRDLRRAERSLIPEVPSGPGEGEWGIALLEGDIGEAGGETCTLGTSSGDDGREAKGRIVTSGSSLDMGGYIGETA